MSTIDLYGRNPDVEATAFHYPYPLVADTKQDFAQHRWFTLPSTSTPVFGSHRMPLASIEDTFVSLDPDNPRYHRQYGLGALPADEAAKPWLSQRIDVAREAMNPIQGAGAAADKGIQTFADFWNKQETPVQMTMAAIGFVFLWNFVKRLG